jgi:hypothetical protein
MSRAADIGLQQPSVANNSGLGEARPALLDRPRRRPPDRAARAYAPLPSVAAIGEFRSGRSSLINALLGTAALPTSLKVQIPYPVLITHAPKSSLAFELIDRRRIPTDWDDMVQAPSHSVRRLHLGLPSDCLKSIRLIDTPGYASERYEFDEQAFGACKRADVIIWCTPAVQAWKASERDIWLRLPKRIRRRGILAVTYKDLIPSERDLGRLSARLCAEAAPHFADVVMIASNEAVRARQQQSDGQQNALWQASGGAQLAASIGSMIAASMRH